jgi:hypothetical protein
VVGVDVTVVFVVVLLVDVDGDVVTVVVDVVEAGVPRIWFRNADVLSPTRRHTWAGPDSHRDALGR